MLNNWKKYKLGELYDVSSGLSKPREEFGFGNPFVSFRDIFYNYFLPNELSELVNTSKREINSCSVLKGDIFLTRTSETLHELGMSSVALIDYPNATFNGFAKRLRKKVDCQIEINPIYIGYYLRSRFFRSQIDAVATMTTRASLNTSSINSIEILIPQFKEQAEIGEILKALDDKIELNLQTNKTLEETAFAYLQNVINNNNSVELKLGDLISLQNGYAFKGNSFNVNGKQGIIKIKNINNGIVNIHSTDFVLDEETEKLDRKFKVKSKDVLIAMTGAEIGKVGMVEETSKALWLNQRVGLFVPKFHGADKLAFLFVNSKAFQDFILNKSTGSAQPNISGSEIEALEIDAIEINVLKNSIEFILPLFDLISNNLFENNNLKQTRDYLLPKLISGEVRVKDAAKKLKEVL